MKKLVFIFCLILSEQSFGQTISAPSSLTIEANATNVDAGDFVVNWANTTDNILISISLEYRSTATFSLPVNTGLTLNTGYTSWSGITSIVFYGTKTNVNNALAAMTVSMGSVKTAIKINLEASGYDPNYYYNPTNKHFYKYVSNSGVNYSNAKSGASSNTYKGKTGYLVTITSQSEQDFINNNISGSNIWIALSDAATTTDGTWKIDAGPESGTTIKTENGQTAGNIAGQYNNWCAGEPNGANHSEDYAVAKWNGGTCWNDLSATNSGGVSGYIVEISADFPSVSDYTGVYATYTVHNSDMAFTLNSSNSLTSTNISNTNASFGGLQINPGHTYTVNSGTTLNTNKVIFQGTGKMVLTDATSKWTPGTSSTTNTIVHSPSTNDTPLYWSATTVWAGDTFGVYDGTYGHYTPWLNSVQAWSAGPGSTGHSLTLSYNVPAYITGIATQGRQNLGQWVTKANVEVSLDNNTWTTIFTNVNLNTNQTTTVNLLFPTVQYAKFVRVTPTDWYGHPSMRLGLLIKQ